MTSIPVYISKYEYNNRRIPYDRIPHVPVSLTGKRKNNRVVNNR